MPVELPPADRTVLKKAPLSLVVCQVRFDEVEGLADRKAARRFFTRLGGTDGFFPKFTQVHLQQVTINARPLPGESPSTDQQRGWRFTSLDEKWHISLLRDSLSVETGAYRSWDEFGPRLDQALAVLVDEVDPAIEQRLGLRFVNVITLDEVLKAEDWKGYVVDDLLAPGLHPILGEGISAAQHRVVLDLMDEIRCILNYGLVPDVNGSGRLAFLLDLDVFRERSAPFSSTEVFKAAELMNERAVSLFQQVTTPELLDRLRGKVGSNEAEETLQ